MAKQTQAQVLAKLRAELECAHATTRSANRERDDRREEVSRLNRELAAIMYPDDDPGSIDWRDIVNRAAEYQEEQVAWNRQLRPLLEVAGLDEGLTLADDGLDALGDKLCEGLAAIDKLESAESTLDAIREALGMTALDWDRAMCLRRLPTGQTLLLD